MGQTTMIAAKERLNFLKAELERLSTLLDKTSEPVKRQRIGRNISGVRRRINDLLRVLLV